MFQNFLILPSSLSCTILNEWLDLECLVRLDTAFCSYKQRISWLDLISSPECVCNNFKMSRLPMNYLTWVLSRKVKVRKLFLRDDVSDGDNSLTDYLKRSDMFVEHLSVDTTSLSTQDVLSATVVCRHLQDLHYLGGTEPENGHLMSVLQNNAMLQRLELRNQIDNDYGLTFTDLPLSKLNVLSCGIHESLLPLFTPHLLRLEIRTGFKNVDLLERAARQCPQLRCLRCIDTFALAFVTHCPLIVNLSVHCCVNLTDPGVLTIVQSLPHLRALELFHAGPQLTMLSLDHIAVHCADTLEILHVFIRTSTLATPSIERFTKLHTFVWYTSCKAYYYWTTIHHGRVTVVLPEDVAIHHFNDLPQSHERIDGLDMTRYQPTEDNKDGQDLQSTLVTLLTAFPTLRTILAHSKQVAELRNVLVEFPQVSVVAARDDSTSTFDLMTLPI